MGELHLDIIVDRLLREFKVEANVGAPQVAYRECFTKAVDVDSKYAKQSGGRGQYGHCKVRFSPLEANVDKFDVETKNTVLINEPPVLFCESSVVGGAIPKEYIPAVGEVLKKLLTLVFLADSLLLVYMLTYMMVPTMKSIHQKWHSTLLVPLHSRKLCRRQHLYFLSLS